MNYNEPSIKKKREELSSPKKEDEQPLRQLLFVLFYFLFVRYVSVEPD